MEKRFPTICGIPAPNGASIEAFTSAVNYKPKQGDIFVASYPKCGTTWLQKIVLCILRKGKPSNDPLDMFFGCPFLEVSGVESLECIPKPLAIKTHLPYNLTPMSKHAKYIYICRDSLDCAVSFFHHLKNSEDITFDQYFELFFSGDVPFGDYLDHLIGWYEHKDDPNVHFVTYEGLKKDTRGEILKIAKFIGEEYWKLLVKEPKILDDIMLYSSFDYMKKETNDIMSKFWRGEMDAGDRVIPSGLQKLLEAKKKSCTSNVSKASFLRKGVVGDWKNQVSSEQKKRYDEKIAKKTEHCDVMKLWK